MDAKEAARLVSLYQPSSPQAKRIDMLRSQLLYPFHGEPPRTIMITSAAPEEGRSLLTANLAISFARGLQQYVMVMDCHLAEPAQHHLLRVPRTPGLTDFLLWDAPVPEIMHWSNVDKLSVIPAGSPSNRSAEILATDKMHGLLKELRSRYEDRYILLDTPPVQAFDDPAVLARMVEGIVVVVLGGVTDRELVLRSIRSLPEEKIVGLVLNDMKTAVMDAPALGSMHDEGG
jgi:capsular exopolysaccharide synthesis family protein